MLKKSIIVLAFLVVFNSCSKETEAELILPEKVLEIKGADLSFLPEIRQSGVILKNESNQPEDMLLTLKNSGVNVIRLRLWKNPSESNSNFSSVKNLAKEIQNLGMKVLLSVHYSDTWADPGKQTKPAQWQGIPFNQLKDSVYLYTKKIISEINPEYIQLGNEINPGFMWPEGHISNPTQFKELLQKGIRAVRETNAQTKIIIHYAGFENANQFYTSISNLDYDIIGLSYYPMWHGKNLETLKQNLITISNTHNKSIIIAETSYPFTMGWNDYTNNVIGLESHILPQFSATPQGQKDYLTAIKEIINEVPKGIGFCYWGAEWVSYKGNTASNGSSYENQAFWDFENKSLPVLDCFK